jgi:hypothetical protein
MEPFHSKVIEFELTAFSRTRIITMANDRYSSFSLDNEVDLTQQMPSTNPASRNVKDHPIEYFHVNSGARFDKPMRQIMAPASDDGPDFTQPNDATQLNDATQPNDSPPPNELSPVPFSKPTAVVINSNNIAFNSPVQVDATQPVEAIQLLQATPPLPNPPDYSQIISPFRKTFKPIKNVYSNKTRAHQNGLRQATAQIVSKAQRTSPRLDPPSEQPPTDEKNLHENHISSNEVKSSKEQDTDLNEVPETQTIDTPPPAQQLHAYLADTPDFPETPSFRKRVMKTPRKKVNFPMLEYNKEELTVGPADEIATQLVQTQSPVGPPPVLFNMAATQPIQSQSQSQGQIQVPSTPTGNSTQIIQNQIPSTQIIPATQAIQSQLPSAQLCEGHGTLVKPVESPGSATQIIQSQALKTQFTPAGESPATQLIHGQSPRVGQLTNASDSPSNRQKDLFLTPKPYLQPSRSPFNNPNSSPINDTQPVNSNLPALPLDRKQLSFVAEESERDTQSTVESHIRPFREVEETQSAPEKLRDFPRFENPTTPSMEDEEETEKAKLSPLKPASQFLDYSSQLSNVEIPGTAEQKEHGSGDNNPGEVNGAVSSSEVVNSSASQMMNIYDDEKGTEEMKDAIASDEDNDEVITSDYENEDAKKSQPSFFDLETTALPVSKVPAVLTSPDLLEPPVTNCVPVEEEQSQPQRLMSSPLAKKNERFKRRIVMDDEDTAEANTASKRQRSNSAVANTYSRSARNTREKSSTIQFAWPEWGADDNIGEKGVWVQWGHQVLVGSLMTGGQGDSHWNTLLSRSSAKNLISTDALPDLSFDGSRSVDVTFYDGKVGVAPLERFKALELEPGDQVKVNYNRKVVFEVVGFLNTSNMTKDQIQEQVDAIASKTTGNPDKKGIVVSPNPDTIRIRDVYGHDYIIVKTHISNPTKSAKPARRSRTATRMSTSATLEPEGFYAVMLCDLYMPNSQWRVYLSRRNNLRNDVVADVIKRHGVSEEAQAVIAAVTTMDPAADLTQRGRDKDGRRKSTMVQSGGYYESPVEDENIDEFKFSKYAKNDDHRETTPTRKGKQNNMLFSGCVFSLTKLADEAKWANAITSHGGVVLRDGFQQLFKLENNSETGPLVFNPRGAAGAEEYRFAAVLSMEPLRTLKYLEALALGWPCLSWHFIADCLDDPDCFTQWESYLLSAGTSKCLGNAPVARSLHKFWEQWQSHALLSTQFLMHRKILECVRVPIFMIEHERISELVSAGGWTASSLSSLSIVAGSGKKRVESVVSASKHAITIKPRSKEAVSLSRTLRLIILMMGADPQLLTVIKDLQDLAKLQSALGNCIVIHNCEGVGAGKPGGRHTTTVSSMSTGGGASGASSGGEWEMTEDKQVLRLLRSGAETLGRTVEYQKEWIVQCLINGRVV